MEIFILNDQLAKMQQSLPTKLGLPRLQLLAEVAWHLRERDSRQAIAMADEILENLERFPVEHPNLCARAHLVRGEALRLFAELEQAHSEALISQKGFRESDDLLGYSDACTLLAWIAMDKGDSIERDHRLEQAAALALQAGDTLRANVACATQARAAVFSDVQQTMARWGQHFANLSANQPPGLAACVFDFLATSARQCSDFARAVEFWIQAHDCALMTGQLRRAAVTATNIGNAFNSLNEHNTALEWMQRSLDLARPTEWPGTVGGSLMQTGDTLRCLGRLDAAYDLLREAQRTLSKLTGSRNYAITLEYLGDLMLDRGDYAAAFNIFDEQLQRADTLQQPDFQISAHRGKAYALSYLQEPQLALQEAHAGLQLAEQHNDSSNQILILQVFAKIHLAYKLPAPSGMQAANPVLHYLLEAIEVGKSIAGYTIPSDLYDAIGREYARVGDFALAYAMALQASSSREKTHSEGATNRAIAMQVRHQTERAQADGEHHRQLAAAEAHRAEILLQTSTTLERLSAVGQDITTHLDSAAVFQALEKHLHGLIDANSLSVFMLEPDGLHLRLTYGKENGKPLPCVLIPVDHPTANSARCLRERREIMVEEDGSARKTPTLAGTDENLSMLYGVLAVSDHVLGVMTVQSKYAQAFGERERLIFRTLCAYGAIAFDNSATYLQLKAALQSLSETQEQLASAARLQTSLVEQKMAAEQLARQRAEEATQMKSAFLANMSHEIRTPMNAVIGLAHLALRTDLSAKQQDYVSKIHRAGMSLLGIINDILDFSKIEAGKLDIEFESFSLDDVLANVASVSSQKAAEKGLEYLFRVPPAVPRMLVGDALRLGQVLINLVNNAIKFTEHGEIELSCKTITRNEQMVRLQFSVRDTGIGMNPAQLASLFQPFTQADSSTSRKFGGTGLGLSISQHLVQLMSGDSTAKIQAESGEGLGSCFSFTLDFKRDVRQEFDPDFDRSAEQAILSKLPSALHGAHVLVVDDNPIAREIFVDALSVLPLRVDAVESGAEAMRALHHAQQQQDPYILVISDWQMPAMDGIALARQIHAASNLQPAPKFILATAFGREEVQDDAEDAGISGFLYKPVSESLLHSTLNSVFAPHMRMVVRSNTPQFQFKNTRILLAEDNEINQQIACELLAAVGIEVDIAPNGVAVLEKLRSGARYPLILMDLEMPELDGHSTTAQIRQDPRYKDMMIVAMTAHALPEIRERCLKAGMQEYLTKPIEPEQLYTTLARLLKSVSNHVAPLAAPAMPVTKVLRSPIVDQYHTSMLPPVPHGSQAAQAALEQLIALLQFNAEATREYFLSIESGLALLLEAHTLKHLSDLLQQQEFEAASVFLERLVVSVLEINKQT